MVIGGKGHKSDDELGGHIASFASVGTLFGIGFNHFCTRRTKDTGGISSLPGTLVAAIYARAFWRVGYRNALLNFVRDVDGQGISSYPHPWLIPILAVPHVSMGLGRSRASTWRSS